MLTNHKPIIQSSRATGKFLEQNAALQNKLFLSCLNYHTTTSRWNYCLAAQFRALAKSIEIEVNETKKGFIN